MTDSRMKSHDSRKEREKGERRRLYTGMKRIRVLKSREWKEKEEKERRNRVRKKKRVKMMEEMDVNG